MLRTIGEGMVALNPYFLFEFVRSCSSCCTFQLCFVCLLATSANLSQQTEERFVYCSLTPPSYLPSPPPPAAPFRFEQQLPTIFKHLNEAYRAISGRIRAEYFKVYNVSLCMVMAICATLPGVCVTYRADSIIPVRRNMS